MATFARFIPTYVLILCVLCSITAQESQHMNRFLPTFEPVVVDEDLSSCFVGTKIGICNHQQQMRAAQRSFQTADGRLVKVIDDGLDFRLMSSVQLYTSLISSSSWEFNSGLDGSENGPSPWSAAFDLGSFDNSTLLSVMKNLVSTAMDVDETTLKPFSIAVHVFRRGDQVKLSRDNVGDEKEYSLILYFNEYWRKNDYGEFLFYEDDNDSFVAISPKYNRVVVWDSSIGYIMKPPSMDFKQGMMCLKLRFTTSATKESDARQQTKLYFEEKAKARKDLFSDMKGSEVKSVEDVATCLTKNYTTSEGKNLYVFDGLFHHDDLMKLRNFVPKHGLFDFDDSLDLDSDNVQWIASFSIDSYTEGKMWTPTSKVAEFVSGTDEWFPYDVSCNLLRTYDHTRIHEDCEKEEKEWTFLVYLTDDWSEDKYGETTFLHSRGHNAEPVISVLPRFGRVVIFDGYIPHSARPPSPIYRDSRLTFVAKLTTNERAARIKSMKVEFAHEEGIHQHCLGHFQSYHDEDYEAQHRQMLIENAQELRQINEALNKRFRMDESDDENDDAEEEENDDNYHQEQEHEDDDEMEEEENDGDGDDEAEFSFIEPHDFDDELLPEVRKRREYMYGLLDDKSLSIESLRIHYTQRTKDAKEMKKKYLEQLRKLI